MIAIGPENFYSMLDGFHEMDEHFRTAPFERNLPVLMGLLGIWYNNFFDTQTVAVLPYEQYLKRFPAYLQQLTMESNGKHVTLDGTEVTYPTGSIYWGEPGTNGQHSFYHLYERSIFTHDAIWQIDSFDQWGIELGNTLAERIIHELETGSEQQPNHDSLTNALIHRYRKYKELLHEM